VPAQTPITLTATTYQTTDYRIQSDPTTTAAWAAGKYTWVRWVEKVGARQTLDSDAGLDDEQDKRIELLPDPAAVAAGYDSRSVAVRAYEAAQAALANFSTSGAGRVQSYAIAGGR
jgi:hypothetical protein